MDVNGDMNLRNWEFLHTPASALKNHLDLQLMSSISEKPLFASLPPPMIASTNGGLFHPHHRVAEPHIIMDNWVNQNRQKFLNIISGNQLHPYYQSGYGVSPEASYAHEERDHGAEPMAKRRGGGGPDPNSAHKQKKKPKTKTKRTPRDTIEPSSSSHRTRAPKKQVDIEINGMQMNLSEIPIPACSCTGTPHQCYRWGSGGWQSACCTTGLSMYPLPMSTKRRGSRIAGRKMSIGAFKKVLQKLVGEGYDFSGPIDLKSYWAKHGTNKFVTIR